MKVRTKIQKWGNSLGLRLSGPIKSIPHFKADMLVDVEITQDGIQVQAAVPRKIKPLPFSEAELLKDLTPQKAHKELLGTVNHKEF
jgi:antitoxin MazE